MRHRCWPTLLKVLPPPCAISVYVNSLAALAFQNIRPRQYPGVACSPKNRIREAAVPMAVRPPEEPPSSRQPGTGSSLPARA